MFYVYECIACMYVRTPVSCSAYGQKRASDPLELELWMVVSRHMGAGNQTQILPLSVLLTTEPSLQSQHHLSY